MFLITGIKRDGIILHREFLKRRRNFYKRVFGIEKRVTTSANF